jgi:hypothetical protein
VSVNPLVVDGLIAAAIAAVVLILSPGVVIAALIAVVVLVGCTVSVLLDRRRQRHVVRPRRRHRPR